MSKMSKFDKWLLTGGCVYGQAHSSATRSRQILGITYCIIFVFK